MTFKNLRTGSTIHRHAIADIDVLSGSEGVVVLIGDLIGQLASDPELKQKHPIAPQQGAMGAFANYMPQTTEQVVNLSVKIGDKNIPITGLNPMADIEDCGGGLFVSCSRDAINAEVSAYKQISDLAISEQTLSVHKTISDSCAAIIAQLNPEIAERQRMEYENKELKGEIKDMKNMLDCLMKKMEGLEIKKPKNYGNDN